MSSPLRPTRETLDQYCAADPAGLDANQAFDVCKQFGPLARWLLDDTLLQKAHKRGALAGVADLTDPAAPALSEEPGSCWIVSVKPKNCWPCLKSVFVLPFIWRPRVDHQHLSVKLLAEADKARSAVYIESDSEAGEQARWGFRPNFGGSHIVDLSGLDAVLDPPSGWAALAAGLILAIDGGTPDRTVWASGAWKANGGIELVDCLSEKARFAAACGAREFYVPADQVHTLSSIGNMEIGGLRMNTIKARVALNDYTSKLDAVPVAPQTGTAGQTVQESDGLFEKCVQYHLRHPKEDKRRHNFEKDFYWTHLYPTILERCRSPIPKDFTSTHLVTIVSGNPEVTCLVAEAIPFKTVLLLYTTDENTDISLEPAMQAVKKRLERNGVRVLPGLFKDDDAMPHLRSAVRDFLRGVPPGQAVLDITPGTGLMKWFANAAMRPGDRRVYLRHDSLSTKDRRPKPGSERLVFPESAVS